MPVLPRDHGGLGSAPARQAGGGCTRHPAGPYAASRAAFPCELLAARGYRPRDNATRKVWRHVFAKGLAGRPVTRVLVTHFHPDHVGLAG
ncbi:MBL fold metallo-hydrolase [Pseudoroseomonas ludipueritiae]|uniref:MBL fold metallo-hydrolase n=1 Tax=Pseudoroseomonas ludipueritiae TaxID=198093 RepID=UPI001EEE9EE1|nr:MBL fold metallo-hydrolase [Pseudoroseomonas ludipueritiae]